MEKVQTSTRSCAWATDMLDLPGQIKHTLDINKPTYSYNQCVVFKSLVNTVAIYVQLWWIDVPSEEDAMKVGNQLLRVLKDGHKVVRRCAEDDSEYSISLLGGAAGECFKIIDDVNRYCERMNDLIVEQSNTKQSRQEKVKRDCLMLRNRLISAHEKDNIVNRLLGEVNVLGEVNALDLKKVGALGEGSFSVVWKANWLNVPVSFKRCILHNNDVAIKEFYHRDHFDGEYGVLKKLKEDANCSHIVKVFGYTNFENGKKKGLVMELMDKDLKSLIEEKKKIKPASPFSLSESINIMLQIAKGVKSLHSVNVIHRDMKPLNVLVKTSMDGSLCIKIADFNTSKASFETSITNTNKTGSTSYMAPEMRLGEFEAQYSKKVDVYSFGIICTEILTGKPVQGGSMPSLPKDIPRDLNDMIRCCCKQEAKERPTFKDIVDTLEENLKVISSN